MRCSVKQRESLINEIARQVDGELAGEWTYHYADGSECFRVCRFNVGADKTIRPIHRTKDVWRQGDPSIDKLPLYRLAELNGRQRIYVCEGEKATDAAVKLGLPATTSAHGSKSAAMSDWLPIADCEVVILPDNDSEGEGYARDVVKEVMKVNSEAVLKIVQLPCLPPRGDIVEYIESNEDVEPQRLASTIEAMAEQTEPVDTGALHGGLIVRRASDIPERPVEWFWWHRFIAGAINLICGMPDVGKSMMTLDMAARFSTGTPWPIGERRENPGGAVAILALEDSPETTIIPRLKAAGADLDRIHIVEGVRRLDENGEPTRDSFDIGNDIAYLDDLRRRVNDLGLVIIDPLDSYIGRLDTKSGNEVRNALWPLKDWAESTGVTILIAHHFNKGVTTNAIDRVSGSRSFGALPDRCGPSAAMKMRVRSARLCCPSS